MHGPINISVKYILYFATFFVWKIGIGEELYRKRFEVLTQCHWCFRSYGKWHTAGGSVVPCILSIRLLDPRRWRLYIWNTQNHLPSTILSNPRWSASFSSPNSSVASYFNAHKMLFFVLFRYEATYVLRLWGCSGTSRVDTRGYRHLLLPELLPEPVVPQITLVPYRSVYCYIPPFIWCVLHCLPLSIYVLTAAGTYKYTCLNWYICTAQFLCKDCNSCWPDTGLPRYLHWGGYPTRSVRVAWGLPDYAACAQIM